MEKDNFLINPRVFEYLGLNRVYALFGTKDYLRAKEALESSGIESHGVFGYYDFLLVTHEDGELWNDLLQLRIPKEFDEKGMKIDYTSLKIGEVVKFRNEIIYNPKEDGTLEIKPDYETRFPVNFGYEHKKSLQEVIGHFLQYNKLPDMSEKKINDLKEWNVLIKVEKSLEKSDAKKGEIEFLLLLRVYLPVELRHEGRISFFYKRGLQMLLKNEKIRTIERISKATGRSENYDYLLHIALKSKENVIERLREVIVREIHEQLRKKNVIPHTEVIIRAEKIAKGKFDAFFETLIEDRGVKEDLIKIINGMRKYKGSIIFKGEDPFQNPFSVKRLQKDEIGNVVKLFREIEKDYPDMERECIEFIGAISFASEMLEKNKEKEAKALILKHIRPLYLDFLVPQLDKILDQIIKKALKTEKEKAALKTYLSLIEEDEKQRKRINDLKEKIERNGLILSTGDLLSLIVILFEMTSKKGEKLLKQGKTQEYEEALDTIKKVISKDLYDKSKKCQPAVEVRNWIHHPSTYTGEFDVKEYKNIKQILNGALAFLEFINLEEKK